MRPQCQKRTAKRNGESRFQFGFCHSFVFCDHKQIASSPQASFCPSREVVIHKRGLRCESALEIVVHGRPSSWEAQVVGRRGRREQPVWGMEVRGAELQESPGFPLGETYCCWHCSSGPGVSTSLPRQQVAIATGWRRCYSHCPLWAQREQCVNPKIQEARGLIRRELELGGYR